MVWLVRPRVFLANVICQNLSRIFKLNSKLIFIPYICKFIKKIAYVGPDASNALTNICLYVMSSRSVLNTDEAGQQVQDTNVERKMEDDANHSEMRFGPF